MAKPNPSAEPSMEEILASIRRIISDDGAPVGPAPRPTVVPEPTPPPSHVSEDDLDRLFARAGETDPSEAPDPEAEIDVLELTETEMAAAAPQGAPLVEGLRPDESEVAFVDRIGPAAEEAEALAAAEAEIPPPFRTAPEPLPPPQVAQSEQLRPAVRRPEPAGEPLREPEEDPLVSARTGATVNAAFGQLTHTILATNARTLDDLVKEMLRPMLRGWLDENLPAIVERLVRAEIERVSRGR
jgi:cell pole-organizing protein PopZ